MLSGDFAYRGDLMIGRTEAGSYRILVVDDEDTTRRSLAEILRLEGMQVDIAEGGEAAIGLLSDKGSNNASYALVLLDLKMPNVDGLEVLRFIEHHTPSRSEFERPSVILLTAHGSLESAIEALRFGAFDYLLKPASPAQILSSVSRALEARRQYTNKNSQVIELKTSGRRLIHFHDYMNSGTKYDPTTLRDDRIDSSVETQSIDDEDNIYIDLARREIIFLTPGKYKQILKLTPTEMKLLRIFLNYPYQVFSHRELVAFVQGYDLKPWEAAEVLRPLVSRLRRKLAHIPGGKDWIINVRGTGYIFDPK